MGFLRAGNSNTQITKYSGLQVQTTSSSVPVPISYGANILAPNCFWYQNFQAHPQTSGGKGGGKGGGGGGTPSSYTYSCAIMMGIGEGPIAGIGNIWQTSTAAFDLASLGLSLFAGSSPQSVWSYLSAAFPSQALTYPGVAYVSNSNYDLGASASVGDNNFEVFGILHGSGVNGVDADPAQVISDFLTSPQYGVGFPGASIDATSLFANSGDSSYQTYCWANYLAISPVLNMQETASSILTRWLQLTNASAVWSGGLLKIIPYGDSAITGGSASLQKTWTPNVTPVYDLTDEDFLHTQGEDPVKITRSDPYSAYNQQAIEIQSRSDAYNTGPIVAFDQSAINRFGLRIGSTITAHEICDLQVAQTSVQLILQRGLYIRNTFVFKLSMEFCLLDPMDLVTLPAYAALPDNTQAPTFDNFRCARSNGSTLTWTCTMPATMISTGHPAVTLWYGSTSVTESGGSFGNADIASSSVNYSTGAVSITFNSGHVPANQTYLWLFEDAGNLISNALFDTSGSGYASDLVAPCTGSGLTYLPSGWSCTLASGGGLTFTWATGTGADGYPTLSVTVAGAATAAGTLTLTNGTVGGTTNYARSAGQVLRAGMNEVIGPNGGTLIGLYDAQLKFNESAGSFTHAGFYSLNSPTANQSQLTAFTAQQAVAGGNGTSSTYPFSNLNTNGVAGNSGGVALNLLTTPIDWTGATPSSGQALTSILHWAIGPVNATVTWSRAQYRIRAN